MYPTYTDVLKVSQDTTLTPSQKLHELFKNSKTEPLQKWLDRQDTPVDPSLNVGQAEVVEIDADGQIAVFRYPDNTYHWIDAGSYITIDDVDYLPSGSHDDEEEIVQEYFRDLLDTQDPTAGPFYRGFWVDEDLQMFFINSYPE
jgi:hypothetical protein